MVIGGITASICRSSAADVTDSITEMGASVSPVTKNSLASCVSGIVTLYVPVFFFCYIEDGDVMRI
jgi:hypothetical protein